MRKLIVALATLASVAGLAFAAGGPAQAEGSVNPFADQARAAGLSMDQARTLQANVDRELAASGGKQVAANKIEWAGGETLVPLPGEATVRDLTAAARPTYNRCPYLYLCTFYGTNFTGTMHLMKECREYSDETYTQSFHSWINNQSNGTKAQFRNWAHNTILTTGLPLSYDKDSDWLGDYTDFFKPCN
ncbi:peptidase inhibitor family I36 protein [Kribbella sp. NPDC051952]|uniref:peptidase inhibitor family I36 protein n=1 Tax=Kribbella sp. NPDC051952 TaxID=3154851 RepID=UPI0034295CB3